MMTTSVLFTNVRLLDGTGAQPYSGEVLVQLAVMKDGVFYKEPEIRSAQTRWGRSVA
jgi:hypothetical protein